MAVVGSEAAGMAGVVVGTMAPDWVFTPVEVDSVGVFVASEGRELSKEEETWKLSKDK